MKSVLEGPVAGPLELTCLLDQITQLAKMPE